MSTRDNVINKTNAKVKINQLRGTSANFSSKGKGKILPQNLKGTDHSEDLSVGGR